MTDAVKMRIVIPFQFDKDKKTPIHVSTKFGRRLIFMWPFSETNAAAMRTLKTQPMPNRQCRAARNTFRQETKDQQGVTIALTLRPKPLGKRHRDTDN